MKFRLHEEHRRTNKNASLFMILIRHREIKMISIGIKFIQDVIV